MFIHLDEGLDEKACEIIKNLVSHFNIMSNEARLSEFLEVDAEIHPEGIYLSSSFLANEPEIINKEILLGRSCSKTVNWDIATKFFADEVFETDDSKLDGARKSLLSLVEIIDDEIERRRDVKSEPSQNSPAGSS